MKKVLVFGAGKSAYYTIHYLLENASKLDLQVTVADSSVHNLNICTSDFPQAQTNIIDVFDIEARQKLVAEHDLIISLLPAHFHIFLAKDCLAFGKNLLTPSYITPELEAMNAEVEAKGLIFLNELGLDPGIDHLSVMKITDQLKSENAEIYSFKSFCGGLVAEESATNPWNYKFSWNPYNVIRAGQDGGSCIKNGKLKFLPYWRLFEEAEKVYGGENSFEMYLNRNSLRYQDIYGLHNLQNFIRGTLRIPGFSSKWDLLVKTGLTSDKVKVETTPGMRWIDFLDIFLDGNGNSIEDKFKDLRHASLSKEDKEALEWLFNKAKLPNVYSISPADALQMLLEEKWKMQAEDQDRVVMIHEFQYKKEGQSYNLQSYLDINGENALHTAMAKTVGLPLALAAEIILKGQIKRTGILLPIYPEIYNPILEKLETFGIAFKEKIEKIN